MQRFVLSIVIFFLFTFLPILARASYLPTNNSNVGIGTFSANARLIVTGGNVGIGSLSPGQVMDVTGTVRATSFIGDGSGLTGITAGASGWTLGASNVGISTTNNVGIGTNLTTTAALSVMSGNVGIGTWRPATRLDVGTATADSAQVIIRGGASGNNLLEMVRTSGSTSTYGWSLAGGGLSFNDKTNSVNPVGIYGDAGINHLTFGVRNQTVTDTRASRISGTSFNSGADVAGTELQIYGSLGTGAGAPGDINFYTGTAGASSATLQTGTQRVTIKANSGNVGIGSSAPGTALDVSGTVRATAFIGDGSGLTNVPSSAGFTDSGTTVYTSTATDNVGIGTIAYAGTKLAVMGGNVGIGTNTPQGGLVVTNGNVGIGTWAPAYPLDIRSTFGDVRITATGNSRYLDTNISAGSLDMSNAAFNINRYSTTDVTLASGGGNVGVGTGMTGSNGKLIVIGGNVGIGTVTPQGAFVVTNGNVGIGTFAPLAQFQVGKTNTSTPFIVDSSGNVGIGTTVTTNLGLSILNGNVGIGTVADMTANSTKQILSVNGGIMLRGALMWTSTSSLDLGTSGANALYHGGTNFNISSYDSSLANVVTDVIFSPSSNNQRGNVGIGTSTSPLGKLTVWGGNVGIGTFNPFGGQLIIPTTNGNVGIGSLTPGTALDVTGTVRATRFIGDGSGLSNVTASSGWILGAGNVGISTTNNVGIGTTIPDTTLVVSSANVGGFTGIRLKNADSTSTNKTGIKFTVTTSNYDGGEIGAVRDTSNALYFNTDTVERMRIGGSTQNGNIGIATTLPVAALNIASAAAYDLFRVDDTAGGDISPFIVNSTGNVGIGTTVFDSNIFVIDDAATGIGDRFTVNTAGSTNRELNFYSTATGTTGQGGWVLNTLVTNTQSGPGTTLGLQALGGNVGVGTFHASALIDISSTAIYDLFRVNDNGTGDTSPFIVSSTGNVGIGTSVLDANLIIDDGIGSSVSNRFKFGPAVGNSSNRTIAMYAHGNSTSAGAGWVFETTFTNSGFAAEPSKMAINPRGGNLGVGTFFPVARLNVVETGAQDAFRVDDVDGDSTPFIINSEGNVGIGSLSPGQALDVTGTVRATRFIGDGSGLTGVSAAGWSQSGSNITQTGNNVGLGTTTPQAAFVVTNGNVGIGTWTTSAMQHIVQTGAIDAFRVDDVAGDTSPFIIDSDGNVGIGTATPDYPFTIRKDFTDGVARITNTNTSATAYTGLLFTHNTNPTGGFVGYFPTTYTNIPTLTNAMVLWAQSIASGGVVIGGSGATQPIRFMSSVNAESARFLGSNMGIGTTGPASRLSVMGNVGIGTASSPYVNTSAPANGMMVQGNVGIGTFANINGQLIVSTTNGNVGIGSLTPGTALDVTGTVRATRFIGDGSGLTGISGGSSGWTLGASNVGISTTNNVGIGTLLPTRGTLEFGPATGDKIVLYPLAAGTAYGLGIAANNLQIYSPDTSSAVSFGRGTSAAYTEYARIINGNMGIGTTNPSAVLETSTVNITTTPLFVRSGQSSDSMFVAARVSAIKTSAMGDGFGSALGFSVRDTDNVDNLIGLLGAARDGADNSGALAFHTANAGSNTEKMRIAYDGNVGIATTQPTALLDITSTAAQSLLRVNDGGAADASPIIIDSVGNVGIGTITTASAKLTIINEAGGRGLMIRSNTATPTNDYINVYSANNNALFIVTLDGNASFNGNNVGIATANPAAYFEIAASALSRDRFRVSDSGAGDSTPFIISSIGNVGIGSLTPGQKLDVQGTVRATRFIGDGSGLTGVSAAGWSQSGTNITQTGNNVGLGTTTPQDGLIVLNGNVGIGTWTTNAPLTFPGTTGEKIRLFGGGTFPYGIGVNAGELVLFDGGSVGFRSGGMAGTQYFKFDNTYGMLMLSTSNQIYQGFYTGSIKINNALFVYGSGDAAPNRVGIGTINPGPNLAVLGGVGIGTTTNFAYTSSTTAPSGGLIVQGNVGIGTFNPFGGQLIVSTTNGNVGIGSLTPGKTLDVTGTVRATAFIGDGSGLTGISGGSSGWTLGASNVGISTTNNVGIGSLFPQEKLSVDGNIYIKEVSQSGYQASNALIFRSWQNGSKLDWTIKQDAPTASFQYLAFKDYSDTTGLLISAGGASGVFAASTLGAGLTGNVPAAGYIAMYYTAGVKGTLWTKDYSLPIEIGNTWAWFATDGNVGINTFSPQATLDVSSSEAQDLFRVNDAGTGDTTPFIIDSVGNVGIGTTVLTNTILTVFNSTANGLATFGSATSASSGTLVDIQNYNAGSAGIRFINGAAGTIGWTMGADVTNNSAFTLGSGADNVGNLSTKSMFTVHRTTGNVGIGTFVPNALLDVSSTAAQNLFRVNDNGAGDPSPFLINQEGNVGIGTSILSTAFTIMNGNVGIGTWITDTKMNIVFSADDTNNRGFKLTNRASGGNSFAQVVLVNDVGTQGYLGTTSSGASAGFQDQVWTSSTKDYIISSSVGVVSGGTNTTSFRPSGYGPAEEEMRIADIGVGIGTTIMNNKLTVWGGNVGIGSFAAATAVLDISSQAPQDLFRVNDAGTGDTTPFIINSVGNVGIGSLTPGTALDIVAADNSTAHRIIINAAQASITAADTFLSFNSTTGQEGSIAGTGVSGVLAYNTFTGSHWSKIDDKNGLEVNMVLEATGEKFLDRKQQLVKSRISQTRQSSAVWGVYGGTNEEGFDFVLALGTGFIWVSNTNGDVNIGDYLQSSSVPGHAEPQDDNILYNYTVAKALEPIQWKSGEKRRLIACTYHAG